MTRWARIAVVLLLAWMVAIGIWVTQPWSDTVALIVPKTHDPAFVEYQCSDVLGAASAPVHHGRPLRYSPVRTPCQDRSSRRGLAVADLGLGLVAVAGVAIVGRRRHPSATPAAPEAPPA